MPGYAVRETEHAIGGHRYRLRVLSDTQQFADPDGHSARIGISSAQWSLFGQVWPAGRLLAQAMHRFDIEGKAYEGLSILSQTSNQTTAIRGQDARLLRWLYPPERP